MGFCESIDVFKCWVHFPNNRPLPFEHCPPAFAVVSERSNVVNRESTDLDPVTEHRIKFSAAKELGNVSFGGRLCILRLTNIIQSKIVTVKA